MPYDIARGLVLPVLVGMRAIARWPFAFLVPDPEEGYVRHSLVKVTHGTSRSMSVSHVQCAMRSIAKKSAGEAEQSFSERRNFLAD